MCIDNFIFNLKKNQKVEISRADFEELVSAYAEYKQLKDIFNKLHFLSDLSYEDLKTINWTFFSYETDTNSAVETKKGICNIVFKGNLCKKEKN